MEKIGINTNEKLEDLVTVSKTTETKEKGPKPIRACIVEIGQTDLYTEEMIVSIKKSGVDVNFYGSSDFYEKNNIDNGGNYTYAISDIDYKNKFSEGYKNCTGVVAVGEEVETGNQISFMSHQYPDEFLYDNKDKFVNDLVEKMQLLNDKTKKGSIDVVIFGGNSAKSEYYSIFKKNYKESINIINKTLKANFDISPTVMVGPADLLHCYTSVYLDTSNRRLYILREPQENNTQNHEYLADDFDKQEKKWNLPV